MAQIRISDTTRSSRCEQIQLHDYQMEEVVLPPTAKAAGRRAIRFLIRGENLKAVAQPLLVFIGKEPLRYLRIAPDERSVEGLLLGEPPQGAHVDVHLGDQDAARHPEAVDPKRVKRIDAPD